MQITPAELASRLVRYGDLRPCTTAFIDTRTPGSEGKENFTIIGPGVAENPDQYVHITVPHGFNIGGARQPPHCVNSQHSHDTAEVFIVHSGHWRFMTGEIGEDGSVELHPGDVVSIPTRVFRGFENIGDSAGFMFAVLGGDDPGRVKWAPYVFEAAQQYGLALLDTGRLIDTRSESIPPGSQLMPVTTAQEAAALQRYDSARLETVVARFAKLAAASGGLNGCAGLQECLVAGTENRNESMPAAPLGWPHGFQLRALFLEPGATTAPHCRVEEEVLLVHGGNPCVEVQGTRLTLKPGDTFTIPKGVARCFHNQGPQGAVLFVVRGGDHPQAPRWQ
jgi:mannose-6-phosphate isomerase-like protein (cupin superfamily)